MYLTLSLNLTNIDAMSDIYKARQVLVEPSIVLGEFCLLTYFINHISFHEDNLDKLKLMIYLFMACRIAIMIITMKIY